MLTVRQFADRHAELTARGLLVVRVFHSPVSALAAFGTGPGAVPFPVLADPEKRAYRAWGVRSSPLSLLAPSAWSRARAASRAGHRPRLRDMLRDGIGVSPADFLVGPDLRLERVHYGAHFTDSLSVDEALRWGQSSSANSTAQ